MLQLFGLKLHIYGLLIGLGVVSGFWVSGKIAEQLKIKELNFRFNEEAVWGGLWWVIAPAIFGARLYHVLGLWNYYRINPVEILAVWNGGLGILGGIFGGIFGGLFYIVWMQVKDNGTGSSGKLNFSEITERLFIGLDLAAFGLPIGQAIGRWGNFFNNELYGRPTDLPWGIQIGLEHRAKGLEQYDYFHPLFLYESLWSLFTFSILYLVLKMHLRLKNGSYWLIYLFLYGFGRFWLEFLRVDVWVAAGLNVAQVVCFLLMVGGLVGFVGRRRGFFSKFN